MALRVGRISSLNYDNGTARIVYNDKDKAVTKEIPVFCSEYYMPKVDDMVYVAHLDNGKEAGIVLGRYWTEKNKPPETGEGLYRKDFSRTEGKCMFRFYDDNEGEGNDGSCEIHNDKDIKVTTDEKESHEVKVFEVKAGDTIKIVGTGNVNIESNSAMTIKGSTIEVTGSSVKVNGGSGDVLVNGISLKNHTHTCTAPDSPSSPPIP